MAKCINCNAKKGKIKCLIKNNDCVCPGCCRALKGEVCSNCLHFQQTSSSNKTENRNYNKVPKYSTQEMEDSPDVLQGYSNIIEAALVRFYIDQHPFLNDGIVFKIYEKLIDKYYFSDEVIKFDNGIEKQGFNFLDEAIKQNLNDIPKDKLVKILSVLWFVTNRWLGYESTEGVLYLDLIKDLVGPTIVLGSGIRVVMGRY